MTSANEAAKAGYDVILVENRDGLGGYSKGVYKLPPSRPPYEELQESPLGVLAQEISTQPRIKTCLNAQIQAISGAPGMFDVHIRQDGQEAIERVGAIVLASGSTPYDAGKLEHLGYGKVPDVITAPQLEAMFAGGRSSDPQPASR